MEEKSTPASRKQARVKRLDREQFFTRPEVAAAAVDSMIAYVGKEAALSKTWLEPSAGSGVFVEALKDRGVSPEKILAFDLEPHHPSVVETDFFAVVDSLPSGLLTIGNPPYGVNSSMAVEFFNAVAKKSSSIGWLVPRFWRHPSLHLKLDPKAHWVFDKYAGVKFLSPTGEEIPAVHTVFQIWDVREEDRTSEEDWEDRGYLYRSTDEDYDLIWNTVGKSCWVDSVQGVNNVHLKAVHPLVVKACREVAPALSYESRHCYSSMMSYSLSRLRVYLNGWMDAHPAEKKTVEEALRARLPRGLFDLQ